MPAYFEQGFSVREPMWHGLGVVLDDYPGRDEAMVLAGHDFDVLEEDIFRRFERTVYPNQLVTTTFPKVAGFKGLVNSKTGELFHVSKDSYQVVQNGTGWDIADALISEPNVKYETAGTLKGGAVCWVLAYLDEPTNIVGDDSPIYPYACVTWAHDGSGAIQARATAVRVVCWNTLSMSEAESKRSGRNFTFRHTKNVMSRIEEAREVLTGIREQHSAFVELANELATLPVSDRGIRRFIREFIPEPAADITSDRVKANIEEARDEVRAILAGPTTDGIANTAWGLVQAGTEYLDHIRGFRSSDTYLGRSILRDESLKAKLVPLARRIADEDKALVAVGA